MKDIFFTSDTHFNAQRTLDLSKRPFNDLNEMNSTLINNWNSVVGKNDIVFHLGDFGDYRFREFLNGDIMRDTIKKILKIINTILKIFMK